MDSKHCPHIVLTQSMQNQVLKDIHLPTVDKKIFVRPSVKLHYVKMKFQ